MSIPRHVTVSCPSRLHFGLWSLARPEERQFGGVGVMIEQPALNLELQAAGSLVVEGQLAPRVREFARRWAEFHRLPEPRCRIAISREIAEHAGLGSGTQLGLSVAAALNAFAGLPSQSPQELAVSIGRGQRSAVGTYGFVLGGLIVEQGKLPGEAISPLDCRIDMPGAWRFVLARPRGAQGLSGMAEAGAFDSLPDVPGEVTAELVAEVRERLVPAAAMHEFDNFAASLYRYGKLSGQCFASRQGGPYNGPVITALVERIRALGYRGVGQSSWGPTVFAIAASQVEAERLAVELSGEGTAGIDITITKPANQGAAIVTR